MRAKHTFVLVCVKGMWLEAAKGIKFRLPILLNWQAVIFTHAFEREIFIQKID